MKIKIFILILLLFLIPSCTTLMLEPAEFAWPVESVLEVDDLGFVHEKRFSLSFDTKDLFLTEAGDSLAYLDRQLRVIRNVKGYYFITSENFKNVYIFNAEDGVLKLKNKIEISESGIKNPAFNQRIPYIEFITDSVKLNLTNEGIAEENNEE